MKAETLELFPNFIQAIRKTERTTDNVLLAAKNSVNKDVYVNYVAHVSSINAFKKDVCDTSLINDVKEIVKSGETLDKTRDCIGEINGVWNKWEECYILLRDKYSLLDDKAKLVNETLTDSIDYLKTLCGTPGDKYAKEGLEGAVRYANKFLCDSIELTGAVKKKLQDLYEKSYDNQYKYFDEIMRQLSKEATLQKQDCEAIAARIKQLKSDISSYNAAIAAVSIAMGVGCAMVVGTFFFSTGYGIVVSLFLLPAEIAASVALADIVSKLKSAKSEIAKYGDYKNKYDIVIQKLNNLKATTEKMKKDAESIKEELAEVNAPWVALNKDMECIQRLLGSNSYLDYEKMLEAFEEIEKEWEELRVNIKYLNLETCISKVVLVDDVVAEKDFLLSKVQQEGISISDFVLA